MKLSLLTFAALVSAPLTVNTQQVAAPSQTPNMQQNDAAPARQMRPVLGGRDYAVSSMKAEATVAGVRILEDN